VQTCPAGWKVATVHLWTQETVSFVTPRRAIDEHHKGVTIHVTSSRDCVWCSSASTNMLKSTCVFTLATHRDGNMDGRNHGVEGLERHSTLSSLAA